jgi:hypothetical protein
MPSLFYVLNAIHPTELIVYPSLVRENMDFTIKAGILWSSKNLRWIQKSRLSNSKIFGTSRT